MPEFKKHPLECICHEPQYTVVSAEVVDSPFDQEPGARPGMAVAVKVHCKLCGMQLGDAYVPAEAPIEVMPQFHATRLEEYGAAQPASGAIAESLSLHEAEVCRHGLKDCPVLCGVRKTSVGWTTYPADTREGLIAAFARTLEALQAGHRVVGSAMVKEGDTVVTSVSENMDDGWGPWFAVNAPAVTVNGTMSVSNETWWNLAWMRYLGYESWPASVANGPVVWAPIKMQPDGRLAVTIWVCDEYNGLAIQEQISMVLGRDHEGNVVIDATMRHRNV